MLLDTRYSRYSDGRCGLWFHRRRRATAEPHAGGSRPADPFARTGIRYETPGTIRQDREPTENGLAIAQEGLMLLKHAKLSAHPRQQRQTPWELRIGSISTALLGIVPDAVAEIARKYAGLSFDFMPGQSTELYRHVPRRSRRRGDHRRAAIRSGKELEMDAQFARSRWFVIVQRTCRKRTRTNSCAHQPLHPLRPHAVGRQTGRQLPESRLASGRKNGWSWDPRSTPSRRSSVGASVSPSCSDWSPPWQAELNIRKICITAQTRSSARSNILSEKHLDPRRAHSRFRRRGLAKQSAPATLHRYFRAVCRQQNREVSAMLLSFGATRQDTCKLFDATAALYALL